MELNRIRAVIAEVLSIPESEILASSSFVEDLGADSLDIFRIIVGIEDEFGIEIPEEYIEDIQTVSDAVERLRAAQADDE